MTGSILQLNTSSGGVPKRPVQQVVVTTEGLSGDVQAHPEFHGGPRQAILLITSEGIAELAAEGFPIYHGALGENITTQGIDRRFWRVGQRWRLGGEVIIEITKRRAPCKQLNVYGPAIHKAMYDELVRDGDPASPRWGLSGMYASVVQGGALHAGDEIRLAESETN